MTTIHLILNGAKIVALKCYGCMPRVWNNQMANIIVEQYNNASFHDGVIDIVPQFLIVGNNVMYGTTTKTPYQNRFVPTNITSMNTTKFIGFLKSRREQREAQFQI